MKRYDPFFLTTNSRLGKEQGLKVGADLKLMSLYVSCVPPFTHMTFM